MAQITLFSAGIAFAVAILVLRREPFIGRGKLFLLLVALGLWSLLSWLHTISSDTALRILIAQSQHLAIHAVPILWLFMALRVVGRPMLTNRGIALLSVVPGIAVIMAWTNAWHGLFWRTIVPFEDRLIYTPGPFFWIIATYDYVLLLIAFVLIVRAIPRTPAPFRSQLYTLLLASSLPWFANSVYIFQLFPIPGLDPTPIAFVLTGLLTAWALTNQRLFDLVPIARSILIEQMRDGVIVLDQQQRILDHNPAALSMSGLYGSQIGKTLQQVLPELAAAVERSAATNSVNIIEGFGPRHAAIEVSATALIGRGGNWSGWLIALRDMTVQQRLLHDLRTERDFVLQVMQTMGEGLYVTDVEGQITFANAAYARLSGYPADELIGRSLRDVVVESDHVLLEHMWAERTAGRSSAYLLSLRRANGGSATIQVTGTPRYVDGQFAGSVAVVTDLSERLAQEAALRTAEQTLRSFFDSVSVLMGIVEIHGDDIVHITGNTEAATFLGVAMEQLPGTSSLALGMPADLIERWIQALRESALWERPVEFDYVQETAQGTRWLAATVNCIGPAPNGKIRYAYVTSDITARKTLEQQLRQTQEQLELANAQLSEAARTDGLTGLRNRRAFDQRLREEINRVERGSGELALLLIDVDHFKPYNDTYGHLAGDEILRTVAQIFRAQLREYDLAARYGGEEFALILPNTNESQAQVIAERIRHTIAGHPWAQRPVTVSIGVTAWQMGQTPEQMIAQADEALYTAKADGRDRVVVCLPVRHASDTGSTERP
jgi:diguanylate cyclase (GGDEF)-like protein/PAS domain S-box-containing protein